MPSLSWEDFGLLPQDSSSNLCIWDHPSEIGCMEKPECCMLKRRAYQSGRVHHLFLLLGHFRWGQLRWGSAQPHSYHSPSEAFWMRSSHQEYFLYFSCISGCHISSLNQMQVLNSFLHSFFLVLSTMTWELHPSWTVATLKFD